MSTLLSAIRHEDGGPVVQRYVYKTGVPRAMSRTEVVKAVKAAGVNVESGAVVALLKTYITSPMNRISLDDLIVKAKALPPEVPGGVPGSGLLVPPQGEVQDPFADLPPLEEVGPPPVKEPVKKELVKEGDGGEKLKVPEPKGDEELELEEPKPLVVKEVVREGKKEEPGGRKGPPRIGAPKKVGGPKKKADEILGQASIPGLEAGNFFRVVPTRRIHGDGDHVLQSHLYEKGGLEKSQKAAGGKTLSALALGVKDPVISVRQVNLRPFLKHQNSSANSPFVSGCPYVTNKQLGFVKSTDPLLVFSLPMGGSMVNPLGSGELEILALHYIPKSALLGVVNLKWKTNGEPTIVPLETFQADPGRYC